MLSAIGCSIERCDTDFFPLGLSSVVLEDASLNNVEISKFTVVTVCLFLQNHGVNVRKYQESSSTDYE